MEFYLYSNQDFCLINYVRHINKYYEYVSANFFFKVFNDIFLILLFSWIVALVNNIYSDLNERVNDEWCFLRSQAEIVCELFCMLPKERQNRYTQI